MKKYNSPDVKILRFDTDIKTDIISASNGDNFVKWSDFEGKVSDSFQTISTFGID